MAAPGYPQMGQMPPGMGGPPMGGPPIGATPMPQMRPIRRGAPKAVPVVVAAGLAVGVFCGLLFGVGTGKNVSAAPASGNNLKKISDDEKPEPGAAPKGMGATTALPVAKAGSAAGSGSATAVAAAGSAAVPTVPAAGSAAGGSKPAVEDKKVIKLTFKLKPDGVEKDAKISIDGKSIDGVAGELPGDTKSFKVEIKANGYRTFEKKMDVVVQPGDDMQVELELQKKPASTGGGTHPIKRPDRPTNAGGNGGGLIDI